MNKCKLEQADPFLPMVIGVFHAMARSTQSKSPVGHGDDTEIDGIAQLEERERG
jgi:hypothetical protein